MDSNFWNILDSFKQEEDSKKREDIIKSNRDFKVNYCEIRELVDAKMYGLVNDEGETIFCQYVGADDGHDDLVDFIIWNGKQAVHDFISNPKTAIPLARNMSKNKNFDGDVNILQRIWLYNSN